MSTKMKLSQVKINGIIRIYDTTAIVTSRFPNGRTPGGTTILFRNGQTEDFNWGVKDPLVEYLGQGKMKIYLVLDKKPKVKKES